MLKVRRWAIVLVTPFLHPTAISQPLWLVFFLVYHFDLIVFFCVIFCLICKRGARVEYRFSDPVNYETGSCHNHYDARRRLVNEKRKWVYKWIRQLEAFLMILNKEIRCSKYENFVFFYGSLFPSTVLKMNGVPSTTLFPFFMNPI